MSTDPSPFRCARPNAAHVEAIVAKFALSDIGKVVANFGGVVWVSGASQYFSYQPGST
jgi:hypothetical protein